MIAVAAAALVVAALAAGSVAAKNTAAPQNATQPTITGQPRPGHELTAHNGTWTNSPTDYSYQWQQCDSSGAGCNAISGATSGTYTPGSGDVDHTIRVAVTAKNADGSATATSEQTAVISSSNAPVNTAAPTISGTAKVGETLTASQGTWTGGVQSYAYQWQTCDTGCTNVTDATAKTYGVRSVDAGKTIRMVVTATNLSGATQATSAQTGTVSSIGGSGTTTTHTPNRAPSIAFVSLRRLGVRIYVRFRLCDDSYKADNVLARDTMHHVLSYTRRYSVAALPCGTHSRIWVLPAVSAMSAGTRPRCGRSTSPAPRAGRSAAR
jgi:hypothetical protein